MSLTRPADVRQLLMQWPLNKSVLAESVFRNRAYAGVSLVRGLRFLRWYTVTIVWVQPVSSAVQFSKLAPPYMNVSRYCIYGSRQSERLLTNAQSSRSRLFLQTPLEQRFPGFTKWRTLGLGKIRGITSPNLVCACVCVCVCVCKEQAFKFNTFKLLSISNNTVRPTRG
jgi:hypothetical protein